MGLFNKLGGVLGTSKELNVEEYMNAEEMENVDVMNEPADFYVKRFNLTSDADVTAIEAELQKRNILLIKITEMNKRPQTLKGIVDTLKQYSDKTNGDIALLNEDQILIVPSKVKIIGKSKKPAAPK